MHEQIQARIDTLTAEREQQMQLLTKQAQAQIAQAIAPYDAALGELKRLIADDTNEATEQPNGTADSEEIS